MFRHSFRFGTIPSVKIPLRVMPAIEKRNTRRWWDRVLDWRFTFSLASKGMNAVPPVASFDQEQFCGGAFPPNLFHTFRSQGENLVCKRCGFARCGPPVL